MVGAAQGRAHSLPRVSHLCRLLVILTLVLGLPTHAGAQATTGTISGTIADAQGGVLPGVALTVRNAETGATRTSIRYRHGAAVSRVILEVIHE